jgi:prepilin-type N-terminal cleavage/methylation domain-containing protein/prepilin-type processing-associated H-X9-DG protein
MKTSKNPKAGGAKAFTLIELLVVVAIIALLISILLPSLSRAKAQTRQLLCSTQLRSMGNAARLYAADNHDYIPRGILGRGVNGEHGVFASLILPYIGWDGTDLDLWQKPQAQKKRKKLNEICRQIPQYHCPDYPHGANIYADQPVEKDGPNPFDYVVSAMPIPYAQWNIDRDLSGDLEWNVDDGEYRPEGPELNAYVEASKIEKMPASANPAHIIYLTEGHVSLPWNPDKGSSSGIRFHTFFLTVQLPFAGESRIANDQRHPNGLNACFFDGHAENMEFQRLDPGYGYPIGRRLSYFTVMPDWYDETGG